MKRNLINRFIDWNERGHKKPILLCGARNVGKTFLACEFARTFFLNNLYINFERDMMWLDFFENDPSLVKVLLNKKITLTGEDKTSLIILDEIENSKGAIEFIKSSYASDFAIVVICSNKTEVVTRLIEENNCEICTLYPLNFKEFLLATGNEWYIEVITEHYNSNKKIPDIVHNELLMLLSDYFEIGGMPSAINEYLNFNAKDNVDEEHYRVLYSYFNGIKKYADDGLLIKVENIFSTIAKQLSKENKKFQYNMIRKGITRKLYEDAIAYLDENNYTLNCEALLGKKGEIFKLYANDVGILYSLYKEDNAKESSGFYKGVVENYVAMELKNNELPLYFWESNSQAKIEFIIPLENSIYLPIEVRENDKTRSKSLSVFKEQFQVEDSIKISTKNFSYSNRTKYVPLYAVFCLNNIIM